MSSDENNDDEVGYGRPPKSGQFRKGQSGNPKGRPKGIKNFQSELDAVLRSTVTVTLAGKPKQVGTLAAALMRLKEKALKGDPRALDRLLSFAQGASETSDARSRERQLTDLEKEILRRSAMFGGKLDWDGSDDAVLGSKCTKLPTGWGALYRVQWQHA